MKIIGILLIMVSTLLIGAVNAIRLKKRVNTLHEIRKLLLRIKSEISYTYTDIKEILLNMEEYEICRMATVFPSFNYNPCAALREASVEYLHNTEDIKWFSGFTSGLGTSNIEGQIEHIELNRELLDARIKNAEDDYSGKAKLYIAIGLFAGVVICMLIV